MIYICSQFVIMCRVRWFSVAVGALFIVSSSLCSDVSALDLSLEKKLMAQIHPGMTAVDVLNLLASPLYREEQEASGREVWEYRSGAIVLRANYVERVAIGNLEPGEEREPLVHYPTQISGVKGSQKRGEVVFSSSGNTSSGNTTVVGANVDPNSVKNGAIESQVIRPNRGGPSQREIRAIMQEIAEQGSDDTVNNLGAPGMEPPPPPGGQ